MKPQALMESLEQARIPYTVFRHATAFTAQSEAEVSHVPGHSWAKFVIFKSDGGETIVAVVPAPCRVDVERLRAAAGVQNVRLVSGEELPALYPDCEPGATPPFGQAQRIFVDRAFIGEPDMVFDAGTRSVAIRMHFADWAEVAHPVVATLCDTNGQSDAAAPPTPAARQRAAKIPQAGGR